MSHSHRHQPDAVPLPATMIHDLSEEPGRNANRIRIRLYSNYPFPNLKNRTLDAFAREALDVVSRKRDATVVRMEAMDSRNVLRVAAPDIMVSEACVSCHNSRADSPKKDWQTGDVRGVLEVVAPLDDALSANRAMVQHFVLSAAAGLLIALCAIGWIVTRRVSRPVIGMSADPGLISDSTASAKTQLAAASDSLARGASSDLVKQRAAHAREAAALTETAEQHVRQSNSSITALMSSMKLLAESGSQMARIVRTIDQITFETNILALNAAVEAARAGDAGLGFSAVADEVRQLAQRAADAARETAALIEDSLARMEEGSQAVEQVSAQSSPSPANSARVRELVGEVTASAEESSAATTQLQAKAQSAPPLVGFHGRSAIRKFHMAPDMRRDPAASDSVQVYRTAAGYKLAGGICSHKTTVFIMELNSYETTHRDHCHPLRSGWMQRQPEHRDGA